MRSIGTLISFNDGHTFWDQTLIDEVIKDLPNSARELVIIPGNLQKENVVAINEKLSQYPKILVIIPGDEGNLFPHYQLDHPDMIMYMQCPQLPKHQDVDRFWPLGPSPMVIPEFTPKKLNWFFAGQVTHYARVQMAKVLREMSGGKLVETEGFSQGLPKKEYFQNMAYACVVPSPGGPISPDSFRLYEALEMGAIPIPDNRNFWQMMFGEVPFPTVDNWHTLADLINNLKDRPAVNNQCFAWWQRQKRQLRYNLEDDLGIQPDGITVLVATSPTPNNPQITHIEETINSVRERLPLSEIILMIDGVREEQADKRKNYQEYTRRLLWYANHESHNIYPLLFEEHHHQANMTREALRHVRTPTILFMEHDTPLCGEIPFDQMVEAIKTGQVNAIRFHFEAAVHPEHVHLMLDTQPQIIKGLPLLRTAQWSQRPHLASTDFYRQIIDTHFPVTSNTMIEDLIYGKLENAFFTRGTAGWNDFKLWLYAPEGDIKRSLHSDAREDQPKYDMRFE